MDKSILSNNSNQSFIVIFDDYGYYGSGYKGLVYLQEKMEAIEEKNELSKMLNLENSKNASLKIL